MEWVRCERCGYDENPASANACMRCHGSLWKPTAEEQALTSIAQEVKRERKPSALGMIVAGIGLVDIVLAGGWVVRFMMDAGDRMSAVQVTQVYTQGGFWVLAGVGLLLAGILWVVSTRE